MASIKELFIKSISEGMKAAEMIPDAASKANAYAAIANALASTNLVKVDKDDLTGPSDKEALKPEKSKGKSKAKEEAAPTQEVVQEIEEEITEADEAIVAELEQEAEQEAEAISAEIFTEVWTDEALAALSDEVEFISQLKEVYDEAQINECISAYTEGHYSTLDDINPLNIRGFVSFMECLIADAQAE